MPYAANGPITPLSPRHLRKYSTAKVSPAQLTHRRLYGADAFWDDVAAPPGAPAYARPVQGQLWPRSGYFRRG